MASSLEEVPMKEVISTLLSRFPSLSQISKTSRIRKKVPANMVFVFVIQLMEAIFWGSFPPRSRDPTEEHCYVSLLRPQAKRNNINTERRLLVGQE